MSRVGSDTVCPGAHLRLCTERGSGGGEREHCSTYDCAQAAQDDNKWDLAYPLMLLEEPPSQLWSYRPAVTQGRLRAFAPLCAQKWAIVALAYAKEADYIQNRKAEISKPKQQATEVSPGVPKAKPKRRPKWQGGEPHDITAPLPPSSSSAQPLQVTATCGRGALACSEKMPVAKASDYGERRPRRRIQRMRVPSLRR